MNIKKSYNSMRKATTTRKKWKQCEKCGNNTRRTLQNHEKQCNARRITCKLQTRVDHNVRPTIEKHNQQQKNTRRLLKKSWNGTKLKLWFYTKP